MSHQRNAWSCLQQQARLTPDKAAIIDEKDQAVTFERFLSDCEHAAALLHRAGIRQASRVALNAGPSRACLSMAFALIRCGAVVVPIDIRFPTLAVEKMVEVAECTHIITDQAAPEGVQQVPLNFSGLASVESPPEPTPRRLKQEGLILFTSGSTGEPKGVSIASDFFLERFTGHNRDRHKRAMSLFKGSITWICVIPVVELCRGDTVLIMPYDTLIDPKVFLQRLIQNGVTEFGTVPSHLRLLTPFRELLGQMKRIYVWGEFITNDLIAVMRREYPDIELFDIYSATESLGYGAIRRLSGTEYNFASGWRADRGYGLHVLNEDNQAAGIGERGEIAFSGRALATGYIQQPELTAKKFFQNRFGEGRLYRTGDIGTLMADGTITLHGREDAQVQIRGVRVELAEVESCATQYLGVTAAAAFVFADEDEVSSIGLYVTPASVDVHALRAHLSRRLSDYAMPSFVAALDELPRTSSGKLNRKQLHRGLVGQLPSVPMDDAETGIVAIYSELLGMNPVRPDDDFYELGGHSLLLAKLITQIHAMLQVDISPLEATQFASPRKLAELVKRRRSEVESRVAEVEVPFEVPLPNEAVLWFGYQYDRSADAEEWKRDMYVTQYLGGHITYTQVEIPACIDSQEKLERALTHLFQRHPILRSRAPEESPPAKLRIVPFSLDHYLVNGYGRRLEEAERMQVYRELSQLFEVPLVKMYVQDGCLHFAFHHLLSDHSSMNIVRKDFVEIAEALSNGMGLPAALDYSLIAECIAYENKVGEQRDNAPRWILPAEFIEDGKQRNMGYRFEIPEENLAELSDADLLPAAVAALIGALHQTTGQVEGNLYMVLDFRSLNIMPYHVTGHIGYLSFVKPVYFSYHGPGLTTLSSVLNHYRAEMRHGKNELPPVYYDEDGVVFNYMESDGPADQHFDEVVRRCLVEENPVCTVYDLGHSHLWRGIWIDVVQDTKSRRMSFHIYASSRTYRNESMIAFCLLVRQHLSPNNLLPSANARSVEGTQRRIASIFSELLDVPVVAADDDFFNLGGHSLLLLKLVTTVNTVFHVQLSPSDAVRHSTPAKLASVIQFDCAVGSSRPAASFPALEKIRLSEEARLWFGYRIEPPEDRDELRQWIYTTRYLGGHIIYKSFVMPRTIASQERLGRVLTHLFNRHPILCARILQQEPPSHMVLVPFRLSDYQVNVYDEAASPNIAEDVYEQLSRCFDVPLIKIYSDGKSIHFAIHHILSDQFSMRIIKRDFLDIARALENNHPTPEGLDYSIIDKYSPADDGGVAPAGFMPWRLDSDQDADVADRARAYRIDIPAVSVQHVLPRNLPGHAIHAVLRAIHDLSGQTEGDLFMLVDQRGQDSTVDNIMDHIGYLSFIRPVRIPYHGPSESDRAQMMGHYRQAIRAAKSEHHGDADEYRILLNYIEDDEPLDSPYLQFAQEYQIHADEVCSVCDFGGALPLKHAWINVTHHMHERSMHVDIYTFDRRYGKQRILQFCHQLHRFLTEAQSLPHNGSTLPAQEDG